MINKLNLHRYFWIVSIILLVSCGTLTSQHSSDTAIALSIRSQPIPSNAPTVTAKPSPTAIPTSAFRSATPLFQIPTLIPHPTELPFTPWPSPSRSYNLENIRMVYQVEGNLYLQDGSTPPRQLTRSGEDLLLPMITGDGSKIVFYRGKIIDQDVYSINADGSNERPLITKPWLAGLGAGTKAGHLVLVPGTHQILFFTSLCDSEGIAGCTIRLFRVDADTGKFKEILSPRHTGNFLHGYDFDNFDVSPNGKYLSVAISGHVDLFTQDGQLLRGSIMTYPRSKPLEGAPRLYWLPDSSGLIAALPDEEIFGGGPNWAPPTYTVWRYSPDSNRAARIPLDPSPMWPYMDCGDIINISPNSNWIVYNNLQPFVDSTLYLGSLDDGHAQSYLLRQDCSSADWSSDNIHFVYGYYEGTYLGSVGKPLVSIGDVMFLGWIDASHYIYTLLSDGRGKIFVEGIEGDAILAYKTAVSLPSKFGWFTYIVLDHAADQ